MMGDDTDVDLGSWASEDVPHAVRSSKIIGAWHCDGQKRFFITESVAPLFGLDSRVAVSGAPLSAYLPATHPEDREWLAARIRTQIDCGGIALAEFRVVATGEVRWLLSRGQYYIDARGRFLGGSGILIDATESHNEGQDSMYAAPGARLEDPLLRLSSHALGLRYAIDDIADEPTLRQDVDRLLRAVGFAIARRIRNPGRRLN